MKKYTINFLTYDQTQTAESAICKALGFKNTLTTPTVIDIFAPEQSHVKGIFKSKKLALATIEAVHSRGAFGGFGKYAVSAKLVEVN